MPEQFRPCWSVGGRIGPEEAGSRSARTTSEELNRLQNSARYKEWQRKHERSSFPYWLCAFLLGTAALLVRELKLGSQSQTDSKITVSSGTQQIHMLEATISDLRSSLSACETWNEQIESVQLELEEQEKQTKKQIKDLEKRVQKLTNDGAEVKLAPARMGEFRRVAKDFVYEITIGLLILLTAWVGLQYKDGLLGLEKGVHNMQPDAESKVPGPVGEGLGSQEASETYTKKAEHPRVASKTYEELEEDWCELPKILDHGFKLANEKKVLQMSVEDNARISKQVESLRKKKKALDSLAEEAANLKRENSILESKVAEIPYVQNRQAELLEMDMLYERITGRIKRLEAREKQLPNLHRHYRKKLYEAAYVQEIEEDNIEGELDYHAWQETSRVRQIKAEEDKFKTPSTSGSEYEWLQLIAYLFVLEMEIYSDNNFRLMHRVCILEDQQIDSMIDSWVDVLDEQDSIV